MKSNEGVKSLAQDRLPVAKCHFCVTHCPNHTPAKSQNRLHDRVATGTKWTSMTSPTEMREMQKLRGNIAWALNNGLGARDLVPMFEKLISCAPPESKMALLAKLHLAEYLVEREPWKAALLARDVLKRGDDERAWAVLGLAHTLLGHHQSARRAYRQALALAPSCPSYAHNLGHLTDVIFNDPHEALSFLAIAFRGAPDEAEVAASYAHALVRCNRWSDARRVLTRALGSAEGVDATLDAWLKACPAPAARSQRRVAATSPVTQSVLGRPAS
jgi:tetratricopeptide (TPR) repeat protein